MDLQTKKKLDSETAIAKRMLEEIKRKHPGYDFSDGKLIYKKETNLFIARGFVPRTMQFLAEYLNKGDDEAG